MLPSLLLATALTAPAASGPGGSLSLPTGLAPVPMYLKADAAGQVRVYGTVTQVVTVNQTRIVIENGKQVPKVEQVQMTQNVSMITPLDQVKGTFATLGGTELTGADAVNRVKNGGVVFVSADGKPVDKGWLRGMPEDTIVVTTDSLKNLRLYHGGVGQATTPAPRLVMLAAGDDGKVRVEVNPNAGNNANFNQFGGQQVFVNNGVVQRVPLPGVGAAAAAPDNKKPLDDVRFDAYDLTGKMVPRAEAIKRLKNGGLALIAGDHRLPDEAYLKAFNGDLLVLASSELVLPPPVNSVVRPVAARAVIAAPAVAVPANPPPVVLPAPIAKPLILKPAVKVEAKKVEAVKPEKP